jgi:hypothetical protein
LTWQAVTTDTKGNKISVEGYNYYRSMTKGGPYTKRNSELILPTTYVDNETAPLTRYYCVITAVLGNGAESAYSPEVAVNTALENTVVVSLPPGEKLVPAAPELPTAVVR